MSGDTSRTSRQKGRTGPLRWDGYRLAVHVEPDRVRIITRGGYDWTSRFASIAAEARQLGYETLILDDEAVVLDDQGRSDFGMLQRALGKRPSLHDPREIIFLLSTFSMLMVGTCADCRFANAGGCSTP
ncbi:hypothetical protein GHK55_06310 [Sinorhizobium meliloti]|nr:hypothetical protein [Sinorhizobium meliloti]